MIRRAAGAAFAGVVMIGLFVVVAIYITAERMADWIEGGGE